MSSSAQPISTSTGRIEAIQYLRAFAALCVVLFHAGGVVASPRYLDAGYVEFYTAGLDAGVDLFFVISGFIIAMPFFLRPKQPSAQTFLKNRLLRIYPMTILTTAIFALATIVFSGMASLDLAQVLHSILLLPFDGPLLPVVLWSLRQEILFYLIFTLVYWKPRIGFTVLIVWSLSSFLFQVLIYVFPEYEGLETPTVRTLFHENNIQFLFGVAACALVRWLRSQGQFRIGAGTWLVSFWSALLVFVAIMVVREHYDLDLRIQVLSLGLASAILVVSANFAHLRKSNFIFILGEASFSIYLIHYLLISVINQVLLPWSQFIPDLFYLSALFIGSSLGGLIYYLVFEVRLEKWRKSLAIGRVGPADAVSKA